LRYYNVRYYMSGKRLTKRVTEEAQDRLLESVMDRPDFSRARIMVMGDVMVDKYHFGTVHRISPEAPVPVVKVERSFSTLGGAGNVVSNITHLHGNAVLIGFIGKDENKSTLFDLLEKTGAESCLVETELPTVTKIRVIGEHQQVVRLDFEEIIETHDQYADQIMDHVIRWIDKLDAVVISDYGKGVCGEAVCRKTIELALERNLPVVVDSKGYDWAKYQNATIIKPNVRELGKVIGREIANEDAEIEKCGMELREKYGFSHVLVTRSEKGMSLVSDNMITHFPTEAKEVFDVSGAGDAVIATLSLAIAAGIDLKTSISLANKAAGIVVSKVGTAPIEYNELMCAQFGYGHDIKLVNVNHISLLVEQLRNRKEKIVFTSWCLDMLHKQDIVYLKKAKQLGDVLIVGIDAAGADLSGGSPIDRAEMIAALEFVDYVIMVDENTPHELARTVMPDVLVVRNHEESDLAGWGMTTDIVVMPRSQDDVSFAVTNS
jgi:D-beta-D-heptose 7-phosphate kinase/D-beta-D-heptose 1-phosphate adenosyltransferase